MRIFYVLISMAACLALPAWANGQTRDVDCEKELLTQQDMNYCQHLAWLEADKELNRIYPLALAAMKQLGEDNDLGDQWAKDLRATQRIWIDFRDMNCALEGHEAHGGSMEPLLHASCLERMTRQRIKDLKHFSDF